MSNCTDGCFDARLHSDASLRRQFASCERIQLNFADVVWMEAHWCLGPVGIRRIEEFQVILISVFRRCEQPGNVICLFLLSIDDILTTVWHISTVSCGKFDESFSERIASNDAGNARLESTFQKRSCMQPNRWSKRRKRIKQNEENAHTHTHKNNEREGKEKSDSDWTEIQEEFRRGKINHFVDRRFSVPLW